MNSISLLVIFPLAAESNASVSPSVDFSRLAKVEYRQVDLAPRPVVEKEAPPAVSLAAFQETTPAATHAFGAEGSWRWNIFGGFAAEFKDSQNRFGRAGFGVSYFMIDDLSLDLELNAMYFDQELNDPWGVNFNLLFRWHFIARDNWSIYLDGGAGLLGTTEDVPDNGSSFNFTPQAGLGGTYALSADVRLMGGVRWNHISNANTYDSNPGRDSWEVYAGLSFPF